MKCFKVSESRLTLRLVAIEGRLLSALPLDVLLAEHFKADLGWLLELDFITIDKFTELMDKINSMLQGEK